MALKVDVREKEIEIETLEKTASKRNLVVDGWHSSIIHLVRYCASVNTLSTNACMTQRAECR